MDYLTPELAQSIILFKLVFMCAVATILTITKER
jgi:hypothetical protein